MLRSAAHTFEQQLYDTTLARLPAATRTALEALLTTEITSLQETRVEAPLHEQALHEEPAIQESDEIEASTPDSLQHLRQDPGRVGLATMLEEMAKLRRLRELKLPDTLFVGIARKVLVVYRNRASVEEPSRLRAHPTDKRLTLLSALCVLRMQEDYRWTG